MATRWSLLAHSGHFSSLQDFDLTLAPGKVKLYSLVSNCLAARTTHSARGRTTKLFEGRDAALRRPDGAARRPYQGKRRILSCTLRAGSGQNSSNSFPGSIRAPACRGRRPRRPFPSQIRLRRIAQSLGAFNCRPRTPSAKQRRAPIIRNSIKLFRNPQNSQDAGSAFRYLVWRRAWALTSAHIPLRQGYGGKGADTTRIK